MSKEIAPSRQVAIKTLAAAMKFLIEAGGSLRRKAIMPWLASEIHFTEWEMDYMKTVIRQGGKKYLRSILFHLLKRKPSSNPSMLLSGFRFFPVLRK